MKIVDQILDFHERFEDFYEKDLPKDDLREMFQHSYDHGRILTVSESGRLLGYLESWRLSYPQFGWVICNPLFDPRHYDIENGPIAYVTALTIHPEFRDNGVMQELRLRFLHQNYSAEFFAGERRKHSHAPIRVHSRSEYVRRFAPALEEVIEDG